MTRDRFAMADITSTRDPEPDPVPIPIEREGDHVALLIPDGADGEIRLVFDREDLLRAIHEAGE